jgi:hypothetical protein
VVHCAQCWTRIELDTAICPNCGFRFGIDAPPERLARPKRAPAPLSRRRSALLTAGGFTVFAALLAGVPPLAFALFFTSPFTALWTWGAGSRASWPVPQEFLAVFFIASYPLAGFAVGYAFPFRAESFKQIWNGVGMRVAIYLIVMGILGPVLLMAAG